MTDNLEKMVSQLQGKTSGLFGTVKNLLTILGTARQEVQDASNTIEGLQKLIDDNNKTIEYAKQIYENMRKQQKEGIKIDKKEIQFAKKKYEDLKGQLQYENKSFQFRQMLAREKVVDDAKYLALQQQEIDATTILNPLGKKRVNILGVEKEILNANILGHALMGKQMDGVRGALKLVNPLMKKFGFNVMSIFNRWGVVITSITELGAALGKELWQRILEAREAITMFGGTTLRSTMTLSNAAKIMNEWAPIMTIWGVNSKQALSMMNAMLKSYTLQAEVFGMSNDAIMKHQEAIGGSLAAFMSMSRVTGMNQEMTEALATNMMLMHTKAAKLDHDFAIMAGQADLAGINVVDLASAFIKMSPAMMMTGKHTVDITRGLARYAEAIVKSNDSLFDGVNKLAMAQRAMQGFADVSSNMDIGMLMAFGDGMNKFQGSLNQMVETAVKSDRLQVLANYIGKITENAIQSERVGRAFFAMQAQNVRDSNLALTMAKAAISGEDLKSNRALQEQLAANKAMQDLAATAQQSLPALSRLFTATIQFINSLMPLTTPLAIILEKVAGGINFMLGRSEVYVSPQSPS